MCFFKILLLQFFFIIFHTDEHNSCSACDWAEYEIDGRCCPMCTPGQHVEKHCTKAFNTSCQACRGPTFTDKPHGRRICNPCTTCNHDLGLRTVKACTASSDTVCGALEGNYCIDPYEGGCRAARKHTTCKPGQFIKHPGTDSTDTVCENCPKNSYSNGSSTSCTPHTDCQSKGFPTVKPGDSVSDSQCGEKGPITWIVVGIVVPLLVAGVIIIIIIILYKLRKCHTPSGPLQQDQECPLQQSEETKQLGASEELYNYYIKISAQIINRETKQQTKFCTELNGSPQPVEQRTDSEDATTGVFSDVLEDGT